MYTHESHPHIRANIIQTHAKTNQHAQSKQNIHEQAIIQVDLQVIYATLAKTPTWTHT